MARSPLIARISLAKRPDERQIARNDYFPPTVTLHILLHIFFNSVLISASKRGFSFQIWPNYANLLIRIHILHIQTLKLENANLQQWNRYSDSADKATFLTRLTGGQANSLLPRTIQHAFCGTEISPSKPAEILNKVNTYLSRDEEVIQAIINHPPPQGSSPVTTSHVQAIYTRPVQAATSSIRSCLAFVVWQPPCQRILVLLQLGSF